MIAEHDESVETVIIEAVRGDLWGDQRVTVAGRLLINRKKSGPWQIFGYDITRSSVPAAKTL